MSMTPYPEFFPAVERIIDLHKQGMDLYGGAEVWSIDRGCIEAALGSTLSSAFYASEEPEDPDPLICAVEIFCRLNKKHCFTDGVKRVAWMTLTDCLMRQGLTIAATKQEAIDFVLAHANGEGLQVQRAVEWVAARLEAVAFVG